MRKWIRNAHLLENAVPTSKVTPRQHSPTTGHHHPPQIVSHSPITQTATPEQQLWTSLHQPQPGTSLPGPGVHPALAHPGGYIVPHAQHMHPVRPLPPRQWTARRRLSGTSRTLLRKSQNCAIVGGVWSWTSNLSTSPDTNLTVG